MKTIKRNNLISKLYPFIQYKKRELLIEGIPASDLVRQFSTPLAIYSLNRVSDNCRALKRSFSNTRPLKTQLYYALKSCYFLPALKVIQSEKLGVEIVSRQEYELAKKAGWSPKSMIWNGPGKTMSDLELAIKSGIQVNVDSEQEVKQIEKISSGLKLPIKILLRVNTNPLQPPSLPPSRMGMDIQQIKKVLRFLRNNNNIEVIGLHIHGLINEIRPYRHIQWLKWLMKLNHSLTSEGTKIKNLNLGGGLAPRSLLEGDVTAFAKAINKTFKNRKLSPLMIQLELGRSIVSDVGVVITRVLAKKKLQKTNWLIVDAGCNFLIPLKSKNYYGVPVKRRDGKHKIFSIGDPTGFIPGIIQERASLPEPQQGDLLCLLFTGAYTYSMKSSYGTAVPKVIALQGSKIVTGKTLTD